MHAISFAARLAWLAHLIPLAGCHYLFPFQPGSAGKDTDDGARRDGPPGDGARDTRGRGEPGRLDARKDACWSRVIDDFEDGKLDPANIGIKCLGGSAATQVTESSGTLWIAPLASQTQICYFGYSPVDGKSINLSGGTVQVRVSQFVPQTYGVEMGLTLFDGTMEVNIVAGSNGGMLTFQVWDLVTHESPPRQIPLNRTAHQYWRIQHSAPNTVTWQTSSTGTSWKTQRTMGNCPVDFRAVQVELWAGTFDSVGIPGVAGFDDLAVTAGGCL